MPLQFTDENDPWICQAEVALQSCSLPSIEMKRERVLHVLHARVVLYEKREYAELHAKQLSLFGNHLFIKIEWAGIE